MSNALATSYPTLSCMLLPINGYDLLLPKSIVSEVVFKPSLNLNEDDNDWLIGVLDWNNLNVPLISFEQLCNQPRLAGNSHLRAVIFHTIDYADQFTYYAVEASSIPRPLILDSRALYQHEEMLSKHTEAISYFVKIGSKELAIPNFEKLETLISSRI